MVKINSGRDKMRQKSRGRDSFPSEAPNDQQAGSFLSSPSPFPLPPADTSLPSLFLPSNSPSLTTPSPLPSRDTLYQLTTRSLLPSSFYLSNPLPLPLGCRPTSNSSPRGLLALASRSRSVLDRRTGWMDLRPRRGRETAEQPRLEDLRKPSPQSSSFHHQRQQGEPL